MPDPVTDSLSLGTQPRRAEALGAARSPLMFHGN